MISKKVPPTYGDFLSLSLLLSLSLSLSRSLSLSLSIFSFFPPLRGSSGHFASLVVSKKVLRYAASRLIGALRFARGFKKSASYL